MNDNITVKDINILESQHLILQKFRILEIRKLIRCKCNVLLLQYFAV